MFTYMIIYVYHLPTGALSSYINSQGFLPQPQPGCSALQRPLFVDLFAVAAPWSRATRARAGGFEDHNPWFRYHDLVVLHQYTYNTYVILCVYTIVI